jgi:lipopolysaccharide/colanic/teichoic acid biosynthesis glycosyltransferase
LAAFAKRLFDIAFAICFLVLFFWVFALLYLAVISTSGAPALYGHVRIGRSRKSFRCWKFRTMVRDSEARLREFLDSCPAAREEWEREYKLKNDPRITRLGRFLRKTSLDELPQIWNVLVGEMSVVGPRPITEAELTNFYGDHSALYIQVRPGITGAWQVSGRNETSYAERVQMDVDYVRSWSLVGDLLILVRTIRTVTRMQGAY